MTVVVKTPKRAMVVVAHPDDAEFGCAGTVAKWAAEGCDIVYVLGTSGDKGSHDPTMTPDRLASIREAEQREAAKILGVQQVEFLRFRDAELLPSLELRGAIVRMIRKYKPDVVICQDPTARWHGQHYIQHPDHIAMGEATLAAVFPSARDRLTFPEHLAEGLEPHAVREVFLMNPAQPDIWIDISATFAKKIEALRAHKSQISEDPQLEQWIRLWAQDSAAEARRRGFPGAEFIQLAEAFKYFRLEE